MNFLHKLIFIFLSIFLIAGAAFAVSFDNITWETFRAPKNKVAYDYFVDYSQQLSYAFDPKKLGLPTNYGVTILYNINRNGTLSDIKPLWLLNPNDKDVIYVIDLLKKNPPKPFPKEIEDKNIRVRIFLYNNTENIIELDYAPIGDISSPRGNISIDIGKNTKPQKPIAPTPKEHFPELRKQLKQSR